MNELEVAPVKKIIKKTRKSSVTQRIIEDAKKHPLEYISRFLAGRGSE